MLEIGRQVEQSSNIAGQAVVEADKTNATVQGLNKTVQRIGESGAADRDDRQPDKPAGAERDDRGDAGNAGKGFAVVGSRAERGPKE